MLAKNQKEFMSLFNELEDQRVDGKLSYPLNEILFLLVASVLSGAESWRAIVKYGDSKLNVLRKFFPYSSGIPSKATIIRVLSALDKRQFESWLTQWSNNLIYCFANEQVIIDGKAIKGARRHSPDASPVFLLNAFAAEHGLTIGQQTIGSKENEITAIPELLDNLSISGATVSIDAIGCQKKIINKILEKEADYFLSVKNNQKKLCSELESHFEENKINDNPHEYNFHETNDISHGRVENRKCWSSNDLGWLNSMRDILISHSDYNTVNID